MRSVVHVRHGADNAEPHLLDTWTIGGIIMLTHLVSGVRVKKKETRDSKAAALLDDGTLNPSPEKVSDRKFQENEFFDPRDLVQVKYEMLRRVSVDKRSVMNATGEYGVSRPTYYQAKAKFEGGGIPGLVPRKRGPRGPRKLRGELLSFVQKHHTAGDPIRARELAELVRKEFSVDVHPRTIERALGKKPRQ